MDTMYLLMCVALAAVVTSQSDSCGEPGTPAPPGPPGGQGCSPSAGFVPTYPPHPDGVRFCGFRECGLFPPGVTRYTCPNGFANDKCGCEVCDCAGCPYFCRDKYCEFGYKVDWNRCPTSECKDDPNANLMCPRVRVQTPGPPCSSPATCGQGELCCQTRHWHPSKDCVKGVTSGHPQPPRWIGR